MDVTYSSSPPVASAPTSPEMENMIYCSMLSFMFEKIGSESQETPDQTGMTSLQTELWHKIWEVKDRINSDPKHMQAPAAIRQYTLEVEVWGIFWNGNQFPGQYPAIESNQPRNLEESAFAYESQPPVSSIRGFEPSAFSPYTTRALMTSALTAQASDAGSDLAQCQSFSEGAVVSLNSRMFNPQSNTTLPGEHYDQDTSSYAPQSQYPISHPSCSTNLQNASIGGYQCPSEDETQATVDRIMQSLTRVPQQQQPPQGPSFEVRAYVTKPEVTSYLLEEFRQIMRNRKGESYEPRLGWDPATGLPMYAIPCFLSSGLVKFLGPQQSYFTSLRMVYQRLAIFIQKVHQSFSVIWVETRAPDVPESLATDPQLWQIYKECWAFLKSWASQEGKSVDIMTYMERYTGDAEAEAEAESLLPPAHPKWID